MKVLQVISSFPPALVNGGPQGVAYRVSKELVRRGHDVTVFTTDTNDANSRLSFQRNPMIMDGIKVCHFRNLSNRLAYKKVPIAPTMAFALNKHIASFDVVHLRGYRTFDAVLVHHYATKKNVPYILQAHGSLPVAYTQAVDRQNLRRVFDWICGLRIFREANIIIALTETEVDQAKRMGVDPRKIRVIPNPVDLGDYSNLPEKRAFREKYGFKKEDKIILYLGRIHKLKGIDLLVEAFSAILKELPNAKLVIAGGDDGFSSALKMKIQDMQISDRVTFTGQLIGGAKIEAFNAADVYVLPSLYETFPNTVLEACACGTPVIMTDRCGIAGVFEKHGFVVECDVNQLSHALYTILNDDAKRDEFAQKGKDLVEKEFGCDKVTEKLEEIYFEISHSGFVSSE